MSEPDESPNEFGICAADAMLAPDCSERVIPHRSMDSALHGAEHWHRVARYGACLAAALGLSETVAHNVQVFAWMHDLARVSDGRDPEHGARGAERFREIGENLFAGLAERDRQLIESGIRLHNAGMTAEEAVRTGALLVLEYDDATTMACVGACWDADRLDLLRLGIRPHAERMSTPVWKQVLPLALQEHGLR